MSALKKFAIFCGLIIGAGYIAYLIIFPTEYLRYRLTLDVDVDGVTHTGSGVVEISYQPAPDFLASAFPGDHFRGTMRGYAITVDLGSRGLLFVVNGAPKYIRNEFDRIGGSTLTSLPMAAYGYFQTGMPSSMMQIVRELQQKTGTVDVPPEKLPVLLRFRDINDPRSNEELDPRNLSAAYGPGVVLKRAVLEFTDDPITPMPTSWPKWLIDEKGEDGFFINGSQQYANDNRFRLWAPAAAFKGD